MRIFAWLLLLVNIGLLIYFNLDVILPNAPQIKWESLEPEKIHLLTQAEIEALPKMEAEKPVEDAPAPEVVQADEKPTATTETAPEAATKVVMACFEWGVFSEAKLEKAKTAIAKLSLKAEVKQQASQAPKRFWVYIPPFESNQAAQSHAAELKNLGVEDLFIVQEPKWKNAISFGLFEDENLAQKLSDELKEKGVANVQKALWNPSTQSSLVFNKITEKDAAEITKLEADFSPAHLKKISCQ